jgi:hypothetical protein
MPRLGSPGRGGYASLAGDDKLFAMDGALKSRSEPNLGESFLKIRGVLPY